MYTNLIVTFRLDQTVDHYVPVDTDSVIHKLRVELVFNYKWCITSEHNFTQSESKFDISHCNCFIIFLYLLNFNINCESFGANYYNTKL